MKKIFFDPVEHKYTDEIGTKYTSVTTIVGKYGNDFDSKKTALNCELIGQNPNHPKYLKYQGKTSDQILEEWDKIRDDACENGTLKHEFIENTLLECCTHEILTDRMFTIEDVRDDLGILDIEKFKKLIYDKYPKIFNIINILYLQGFRFFPELVVFNDELKISGTIDLFVVKQNKFLIIDWKTNRGDIKFESGYFEKDHNGNIIRFIEDRKKMKSPLFFVPDSTGNHYNLQVSGYAWIVEQFGYQNLNQNMIFQIRDEIIDVHKLKDMRDLAEKMFRNHFENGGC